jgi:Mg2+ and Co2+ transporter CorA
MVQMGERARQDNNNMKLIALVGLAYLPGSFVSSFFGMGFFSSGEEDGQQTWQVSEKLWLYAAITVPLTLSTVIVWALANYRHVITRGIRNSIQRKSRTDTNTMLLRTR